MEVTGIKVCMFILSFWSWCNNIHTWTDIIGKKHHSDTICNSNILYCKGTVMNWEQYLTERNIDTRCIAIYFAIRVFNAFWCIIAPLHSYIYPGSYSRQVSTRRIIYLGSYSRQVSTTINYILAAVQFFKWVPLFNIYLGSFSRQVRTIILYISWQLL